MSDPYTEATRNMSEGRFSPLGKALLILGGLGLAGLATLLVMWLILARAVDNAIDNTIQDAQVALHEFSHEVEAHATQPKASIRLRGDSEIRVADAIVVTGSDVAADAKDANELHVSVKSEDGERAFTIQSRETTGFDRSDLKGLLGDFFDGYKHVEGHADQTGGVLRIFTPEGETTIELSTEGDGALHINSPGRSVHVGVSDGMPPSWVPIYPETSEHKRLASQDGGSGRMGVYALRTEAAPADVLEWYAEELRDKGFSFSIVRFKSDDLRGRIKAENEGRNLMIAVGSDDDELNFILIAHWLKG